MGTFLTFYLVIVTTTTLNVSHIQLNLYIASISFIPPHTVCVRLIFALRRLHWAFNKNLRHNLPVAHSTKPVWYAQL